MAKEILTEVCIGPLIDFENLKNYYSAKTAFIIYLENVYTVFILIIIWISLQPKIIAPF